MLFRVSRWVIISSSFCVKLHVCVQRKQEEISALKERNAQLKELVKEAEIYAAVLDVSQAELSIVSKMRFVYFIQ